MINDIDFILRNNLKSIRSRLGITQLALAQEIGVQKSYCSRLERGEFIPNIKLCLLIHRALINIYFQRTGKLLEKLTIDRLFYIEEQKQPQDQC